VTAHRMRGLHGTLAVERGATTHVVAQALGHELETTSHERYISRTITGADQRRGSRRSPADWRERQTRNAVMIRRIPLPRSLVSEKTTLPPRS
jgi:integrase